MTGLLPPEGLADALGGQQVARDTVERLTVLSDLLARWNPTVNLVAKSTLPDRWARHILDSAQIFAYAPPSATRWADLGSGGGFPGLVVAAIAVDLRPTLQVTLVESDQRKAAFLREASRTLGLVTTVIVGRVESIPSLAAEVLSARALAPLSQLLGLSVRHLVPSGTALFMKGASHLAEIAEAKKLWAFDLASHPSKTDRQAVTLCLTGIRHV